MSRLEVPPGCYFGAGWFLVCTLPNREQQLIEMRMIMATLSDLAKFFGGNLATFKREWNELSQEEKDWYKAEYDKAFPA